MTHANVTKEDTRTVAELRRDDNLSMSKELSGFIGAAKSDSALQERVRGARSADAVAAIAVEAGFAVQASELRGPERELSDNELDKVAGGVDFFWDTLWVVDHINPAAWVRSAFGGSGLGEAMAEPTKKP